MPPDALQEVGPLSEHLLCVVCGTPQLWSSEESRRLEQLSQGLGRPSTPPGWLASGMPGAEAPTARARRPGPGPRPGPGLLALGGMCRGRSSRCRSSWAPSGS